MSQKLDPRAGEEEISGIGQPGDDLHSNNALIHG